MSRLCEPFVEQTSAADKQRRVLAVGVEGSRAGRAVDVEHPRDEGKPHAGQHARATFRECVAGVTSRPTARIGGESGCIRRGASAHPPSSVFGRAARAGANGWLRNEAGGAGAFQCDAAPTLALLLLWHVQTLVDPEQLSTRGPSERCSSCLLSPTVAALSARQPGRYPGDRGANTYVERLCSKQSGSAAGVVHAAAGRARLWIGHPAVSLHCVPQRFAGPVQPHCGVVAGDIEASRSLDQTQALRVDQVKNRGVGIRQSLRLSEAALAGLLGHSDRSVWHPRTVIESMSISGLSAVRVDNEVPVDAVQPSGYLIGVVDGFGSIDCPLSAELQDVVNVLLGHAGAHEILKVRAFATKGLDDQTSLGVGLRRGSHGSILGSHQGVKKRSGSHSSERSRS